MDTPAENRRHPRVPLNVPVVITTTQEPPIKGETGNLSIGGALILCPKTPESEKEFQISLTFSENNEISVTCEKVWTSTFDMNGSILVGVGVSFTDLSAAKHDILATQISEYQL